MKLNTVRRRYWLAGAAAIAMPLMLGKANAASPVVEIITFAHPPVWSLQVIDL